MYSTVWNSRLRRVVARTLPFKGFVNACICNMSTVLYNSPPRRTEGVCVSATQRSGGRCGVQVEIYIGMEEGVCNSKGSVSLWLRTSSMCSSPREQNPGLNSITMPYESILL